jgi:hypothetical protein
VTDGPNFGSDKVLKIVPPRIAIAWDEPTSSIAAGATRFVIERQFDYPVTAIRTSQLASADLRRFQVLILPEQAPSFFSKYDYDSVLGQDGVANIRRWVASGGVLIGLGTAMRFLSNPDNDLLSSRREDAISDNTLSDVDDNTDAADKPAEPADQVLELSTVPGNVFDSEESFVKAIQPERESPDSVSGVLVAADVDPDHWLAAGVARRLNVLVRGGDIYTPIHLDKGVNISRFTSAEELLTSGYLWEENREQLAYKPFVMIQPTGRGFVIGFTQDPNFRAYLDGLNLIFMNAIFRASAHAKPLR